MKGSKIAIYSRKSKFTGKGESIENQIEQCRQYLEVHYPELSDCDTEVYEDEGYSGKNLSRPKFQEMIKEIRSGNVCMLICYRLDRISRNVSDFSGIIEELKKYDTAFVSIKENFDTGTPMGKAMMYICSVFAELERETIAERIRDNMYELSKTGRWLGGTTPTGYESVPIEKVTIDGKIRTAYKLSVIEEEAGTVRLIYKKFLELNSQTKLETYLIQNAIYSKNGKKFTRCTLKAILENPEYVRADESTLAYFKDKGASIYSDESEFDGTHGIMTYNKTVQNGKAKKAKPIEEWIVTVGKHEPIIDSSDWIRVQKILDINKSKSYRKPRSHVALLSGLLRCGHCGDFMRPKLYNGVDENGNRKYGYLCHTKESSRQMNCSMNNAPGNILDEAICSEIKKLSENSSEFIKQLEKAKASLTDNTNEQKTQLEALKKTIADKDSEIKNLIGVLSHSDNNSAHDYILKEIDKLHKEKARAEKQLTSLDGLARQNELSDMEFDLIKDILVHFGETFDTMSVDEKRAALRVFVNKIVWDGENAHIYLFGSNEDTIEPLGRDCKRGSDVSAVGAEAQP